MVNIHIKSNYKLRITKCVTSWGGGTEDLLGYRLEWLDLRWDCANYGI
jgi:hypothetical protein